MYCFYDDEDDGNWEGYDVDDFSPEYEDEYDENEGYDEDDDW